VKSSGWRLADSGCQRLKQQNFFTTKFTKNTKNNLMVKTEMGSNSLLAFG